MSEVKWLELVLESTIAGWCMCRVRNREPHPVLVVASDALRNAPDDEQQSRIDGLIRERDALRDRVAELERELDAWKKDCKGWEARAERAEARATRFWEQLEEAANIALNQPVFAGDIIGKQSVKSLVSRGVVRKNEAGDYMLSGVPEALKQAVRAEAERDKARREAEREREAYDAAVKVIHRLRAENERLRERVEPPNHADWQDLEGRVYAAESRIAKLEGTEPDQPAPQPHYREGDVVLPLDDREYRLVELHGVFQGEETWLADDGEELQIEPGAVRILERDGVPTDEGLRRLAERAGYSFVFRSENACAVEGMSIDRGIPHSRGPQATLYGHDPKWRKRLAAALREMGGA